MAKCKLCHRTTINTGCSQDTNTSIWNLSEVLALKECPLNFAKETSLKTHMGATKCLPNMGSTALKALDVYSKNRAFQQEFRYLTGHLNTSSPFVIQVSLHFCFGISNPAKDMYCKSKLYCHFVIILKKMSFIFV